MQRQQRKIIRVTIVTLVVMALLAVASTISVLYKAALDVQSERLGSTADSIAQLLALSTAATTPMMSGPELREFITRHHFNDDLGRSGEIVIARQRNNEIQLLVATRREEGTVLHLDPAQPIEQAVWRALRGETGITNDTDYRRNSILAAYRPLPELGMAVVTRMELKEIRKPFLAAAFGSTTITLIILLLVPIIYTRLVAPLFRKLSDEEERYRALVELSPYGVLVVDAQNGHTVAFNHVAHEQLGYTAEEFRGLSIPDYEVIESPAEVQAHIERVLATGGDDFDTVHRTKSGELRSIHVHVKTFHFEGRLSIHTIFRDITEQKAAERELEQYRTHLEELVVKLTDEQERYRALVELSPYGVLVVDAENGKMVAFNRIAHEQLGYTAEEFSTLSIPDYEVVESPQEVEAHIQKILEQGQDDFDTLHRTKSGELRNIHVHVKTFQFGGRLSFHTIFRDITEQVASQKELALYREHLEEVVAERSQELLAANAQLEREIGERRAAEGQLRLAEIVYRNTLEGVFVTDAQGTILATNPAFSRITGYNSSEAIGKNPRILKSHHQPPAFYKQMWETLTASGQWSGEIWNRRKDGEAYLQQLTITVNPAADGTPLNYVSVFSDITALREKEEHIRHQAYHDALTDLPNRVLFEDRLTQALLLAERSRQPLAVMFLDLDRFKVINDTLGHHIGDNLLRQVAMRLAALLRQSDTVSRFGGDEFVILLSNLDDILAVEEVATKIIEMFTTPFLEEGHDLVISTSIGIALYPEDGADATTLLKNADAAMYGAKESGRNNFQFYQAEMNAKAAHHLALEHRLRKGLENSAFELHYQPRVELASGAIIGVEALIRWNDPEHGRVSPAEFIPVAEESGLIVAIGQWVLESACQQAKAWHDMGHPLRVSVNISARQFSHSSLVDSIAALLQATGLPGSCLELELTESLVMKHAEQTIETLKHLKQLGVWIAIDDFGTGYSSLSYLKRFPIDILKVDQSFVREIATDSNDAAIVETIIALGRSLGLEVLAEGVETSEQLDFLGRRGCHSIQGYYFSRPIPVDELTRLLDEGRTLQHVQQGVS